MKIIKLKKTSSTEDYIRKLIPKQLKTRENLAVIAETQTGGRGTKGRSFLSPKGGLYMSLLYFHNGLKGEDAFTVNKNVSVAVVKTLLAFGINARIKWPNDIYVSGKKICGMLINNVFSGDYIDYTILGIGINVNNDIPPSLCDIAVSIEQISGKKINLDAAIATLVYNLLNPEKVDLYARYSMILGKMVKVLPLNGEPFFAVAKEILPDGRLMTEDGIVLTSEEVSLKLD